MSLEEIRTKKQLQIEKRLAASKLNFDLSWWIKWTSSLILLVAMILRGGQAYPFVDLCLSALGCAGWLAVGVMWKDRALVILNAVGFAFLVRNLLEYLTV